MISGLNHRMFRDFLDSQDSECEDILFYNDVRWLSRGKCLQRFYKLREEIAAFMTQQKKTVPQLQDEKWVRKLAFLVDVSTHLNTLNVQLQGKDHTIVDFKSLINGFKEKLSLWVSQVGSRNFVHFPTLDSETCDLGSAKLFSTFLKKLEHQFDLKFSELEKLSTEIAIFCNPFEIDPSTVPAAYQMELIELKNSLVLKRRFDSMDSLEFWKLACDLYPKLKEAVILVLAIFPSTYICEQMFSLMKFIKSPHRSRITDDHLSSSVRVKLKRSLAVDFDELVKREKFEDPNNNERS